MRDENILKTTATRLIRQPMTRRRIVGLFAGMLVPICLPFPRDERSIQKPFQSFDYTALYQSVLDAEFPRDLDPPSGYMLIATLRFHPFGSPESQINIIQDNLGKFTVVRYSLPAGSRSIWSQLSDLYFRSKLSPSDNPLELAKHFAISVHNVDVPTEIMKNLFIQLGETQFPSMEVKLQPNVLSIETDTNQYDLWYKTVQGDLHFHFYYDDMKVHEGHGRELADWMDRVKKAVDSTK
jgi:hypothetical protein